MSATEEIREIMTLVESITAMDPPPGPYFHVTQASRLKSILRQGVVPGKKRLWSNRFGGKLGHRDSVYLFSDFTMAVRWAHRINWEFQTEPVILVVPVPPEGLLPDDHAEPGNGRSWWRTTSPITPAMISRVIHPDADLYRQVGTRGVATLPPEEPLPESQQSALKAWEFAKRGLPLPAFQNTTLDATPGEEYGIFNAYNPETREVYGSLTWTVEDGSVHITFLEVQPAYQRFGIGSELLRRFEADASLPVVRSARTPEGERFIGAYDAR